MLVGYRLNVNDAIPPVITHDKDLDAFITKDGENFAFIKIELRSTYFYCESDEKRYPHYAKLAKDAGFSYAVIFREYGDRDEFLMRDLRKGLSITSFVPVASLEELVYILFNEPDNEPSQVDWKMSIVKVLKDPKKGRWNYKRALESIQKAHVTVDKTTKHCSVSAEEERKFFNELLDTYDNEYICRYTTYSALERILREKKQSVCSVVCMNDETECYYADEYLEQQGAVDKKEAEESNYKELNDCQISSCTDINLADRLSLWSMYGDDAKGVCLKFKIDRNLLEQKGFLLYQMSYPYIRTGEHYELDVIADLLKMRIKGYVFDFNMWHIWKHFFKPIHYLDEQEVRLLYFKKDTDQFKWIRTGDSQILAPVIEFGIEKGRNEFPLVLSEIILGPKSPEAATNAAQIKYFKALQQIEEDGNCPVTISKIKGYR